MQGNRFGMEQKNRPGDNIGEWLKVISQNTTFFGVKRDTSTADDLILNPHIAMNANGDYISVDEDMSIHVQQAPVIEAITQEMYEAFLKPHPLLENAKDKPVRVISDGRPTYGVLGHINSQLITLDRFVEPSLRPQELVGPIQFKTESAQIVPISQAQYDDILADHPFVKLEDSYVRIISDGRPVIGHVEKIGGEKVTLDRVVVAFGEEIREELSPRVYNANNITMEGLSEDAYNEYLHGHHLNVYKKSPVAIINAAEQIIQYGVVESATSETIRLSEFLDPTQNHKSVDLPMFFNTSQVRLMPLEKDAYDALIEPQKDIPPPGPESTMG